MQKFWEFFTIGCVLAIFVIGAVVLGLTGVKNGGSNYVEIEINPKVEFITDSKDKVVTIFPINQEAKELIINEQFEGMEISEAIKKYLKLATDLNYIDVERDDNVVKLTCVSGLTKALEVKLYKTINSYLINNEIMGVVIENTEDLQEFKEAKKLGISNDKFSLVESVLRLYPDEDEEKVKNLTETALINKIKTAHNALKESVLSYTESELNNKAKLIDLNRVKIEQHQKNISNQSISKFKEEYVKNKKQNASKYEKDFDKMSAEWKENRTNNEYA